MAEINKLVELEKQWIKTETEIKTENHGLKSRNTTLEQQIVDAQKGYQQDLRAIESRYESAMKGLKEDLESQIRYLEQDCVLWKTKVRIKSLFE